MERYLNLGGDSNVSQYEILPRAIRVAFNDGGVYRYDYESSGKMNVEQMKALARAGQGLHAFINRYVRKQYAARER